MKRWMRWGVANETNVTYGDAKPTKTVLIDPRSIGSKSEAEAWRAEHGGRLTTVEVYS